MDRDKDIPLEHDMGLYGLFGVQVYIRPLVVICAYLYEGKHISGLSFSHDLPLLPENVA